VLHLTQIYAIHGGNSLDYDGWVVLTRGIGRDPNDQGGENLKRFRQTPIVRLNHGYAPWGTIPRPEHYADFAQRCANFVRASPGCSRWIIGNEMNHEQERPDGQPITPGMYAECFTQCRDAIRGVRFHNGDQVLVGAVAPWNAQTRYAGNPAGDWIRYFEDVQHELGVNGCDGFALHTYARAQTPEAVVSPARMNPPFEMHHNGFRTYWDWMNAILPRFQGLPCYVTETNAIEAWLDVDTGFVTAAYDEIDGWNSLYPSRPILCLALYRWEFDRWAFRDKYHVHADFYNAVERGYAWPQKTDPPMEDDMLTNPSFELPYNQHPVHSTVRVANGWHHFASDGKPPERDVICALPEYKPLPKEEDAYRVHDGDVAQCWFLQWKIMDAGVYQQVSAQTGATYQFDVMAHAWCSDSDNPRDSPGDFHMMLGIDPTGDTDPWAPGVMWTSWQRLDGTYRKLISQPVKAQANQITLFVRAWNKWELKHNDAYIDDAHLTKSGGEPPGGGDRHNVGS
jgi:hypothetical protein